MAAHNWPYEFEGSPMETPMFTFDSKAAWFIMRHLQDGALGSLARVRARMMDLEDELEEHPAHQVMVLNEIYQDEGRVFMLPDDSRVLLVRSNHPENPEEVFCLYRYTGEVAAGAEVYVDFAWNPPVASRQEPLAGNWIPPRTSLETRKGSI